MVSWTEAKKPSTTNNREIERVKIPTGGSVKLRLLGPLLPRYTHWVQTPDGKRTIECLSFNRDTQQFDISKDPIKELTTEQYPDRDKPTFAYMTNVLDRSTKTIKLYELKRTTYDQIVKLAMNPEYGDPSDPVKGYDITIDNQKTGPKPMNVKYTVTPSRQATPLTEEEKNLDLYNLDILFKRPTYEDQKEWLLKNTSLFSEVVVQDLKPKEAMQDV